MTPFAATLAATHAERRAIKAAANAAESAKRHAELHQRAVDQLNELQERLGDLARGDKTWANVGDLGHLTEVLEEALAAAGCRPEL